jgi:hypothetical protein
MADSKISALTDAGAPVATDQLVLARSGSSLSVLFSAIRTALQGAHAARVKRSSGDFSVGNNTLTAVAFTAEDYDTDTIHDNSTNNTRLTIPSITGVTTGLWRFAAFGYTNATSGRVDCEIRLNGSTVIAFNLLPANSSGASSFFSAGDYVFSATDYIECLVRTTAGSFSVIFDAPSPTFEVHFIGKVT